MTKQWLAIAVCALGACSKKSGDAAKVDIGADHVAAVNAAIPPDLKGKIEFELGTVEAGRKGKEAFKLAVPKGWKKGFMPGSLEPADSETFGSKTMGKTSLKVGSDCNGTCEK